MGFNFPNSPTPGQIFLAPGGPQYVFSEGVWRVADSLQTLATARERNRIVNPAMQISQENADTYSTAAGYYPADEWIVSANIATCGAGRHPTLLSPNGSRIVLYSLTTAKPSLAAGEVWQTWQFLEGIRIDDFMWGTANAEDIVVRFWASSTLPGNYTMRISNGVGDRAFLAPIALTATMKEFVIPVPGDVTGTWAKDNTPGMLIAFGFASGATYLGVPGWQSGAKVAISGSTNGAGVANTVFALGDVGIYADPDKTGLAPPWEPPNFTDEVVRCQRYYQIVYDPDAGMKYSALAGGTQSGQAFLFPVLMRTTPAVNTTGRLFTNATFGDQAVSALSYYVRLAVTAAGGYRCYNGANVFNARM